MILRSLLVTMTIAALAANVSAQKAAPAATPPPSPVSRMNWAPNFDTAKQTAADYDAPIILYFFSNNNAACQDFEQKIFGDATFRKLSVLFVMVRADAAQQKDLMAQIDATKVPSLVFLDSGGRKMYLLEQDITAKQALNIMGRSYLTSMYNSAKAAREAGHVRVAVRRFKMLMALGEGTPPAAWAQKELDTIGTEALKKFSQAQIALDKGDTLKGMTLLDELAYEYRGTKWGPDVKDFMDKLEGDKNAQEALKEVGRRKDAARVLALAKKLDEKKDAESALITYWDVARDYPGTPAADEATARAAELAKDKALADKAAAARQERDCKQWMELAADFAQNKMKDKAVELYRRVIKEYPGTTAATAAQAALEKLTATTPK